MNFFVEVIVNCEKEYQLSESLAMRFDLRFSESSDSVVTVVVTVGRFECD